MTNKTPAEPKLGDKDRIPKDAETPLEASQKSEPVTPEAAPTEQEVQADIEKRRAAEDEAVEAAEVREEVSVDQTLMPPDAEPEENGLPSRDPSKEKVPDGYVRLAYPPETVVTKEHARELEQPTPEKILDIQNPAPRNKAGNRTKSRNAEAPVEPKVHKRDEHEPGWEPEWLAAQKPAPYIEEERGEPEFVIRARDTYGVNPLEVDSRPASKP